MSIRYTAPATAIHRAAFGLLAVSALVFIVSGVRAFVVSPLPPARAASAPASMEPLPDREPTPLWSALRAVQRDPFHPSRTAPDRRYVLPEDDFGEIASRRTPGYSGELRLVGTAVSGDGGGFAMCQLGRDPPKIVRIGEALGGYRLQSVSRGQAEFVRADGTVLILRVPGASNSPTEPGEPQ